jgi:ribA/ribD-fused uncharacterized protein
VPCFTPQELPVLPSERRLCNKLIIFGGRTPLSRQFPSRLEDEAGIVYNSLEQFYQSAKSLLFGDKLVYRLIMHQTDTFIIRRMGKLIREFNPGEWIANREQIMAKGCEMKFRQNPVLLDYLVCTLGRISDSSSPANSFWGTGIPMYHLHDPKYFPDNCHKTGEDRYGAILTDLRTRILTEVVDN